MWSVIDQYYVTLDKVPLQVRQFMRECVRIWIEVNTRGFLMEQRFTNV